MMLSKEAIVSKAFPDAETLETHWDQLIRIGSVEEVHSRV